MRAGARYQIVVTGTNKRSALRPLCQLLRSLPAALDHHGSRIIGIDLTIAIAIERGEIGKTISAHIDQNSFGGCDPSGMYCEAASAIVEICVDPGELLSLQAPFLLDHPDPLIDWPIAVS